MAHKRPAKFSKEQSKFQYIYKDKRWKRISIRRRIEDPLCVKCLENGFLEPATQANHIIALEDDISLAFEYTNTESVCDLCHLRITAQEKKDRNRVKKEEHELETERAKRTGGYISLR